MSNGLIERLADDWGISREEAEQMVSEAADDFKIRKARHALVEGIEAFKGKKVRGIEVELDDPAESGHPRGLFRIQRLKLRFEDGHYIECEGGAISGGWTR